MEHDRAFRFADHYKLDSDERRRYQPPEPLVELIAAAGPGWLADLGAGTGYFALPLLATLPRARLIALDIEPRMLDVLARRGAAAGVGDRLECRRIEAPPALPVADGTLDAALLASLWHELPDPAATLAELARALAPAGRVVICDWSPGGSTDHGPPRDHRIAPAACVAALTGGGWREIAEHALYPDHWTLSARTPAASAS